MKLLTLSRSCQPLQFAFKDVFQPCLGALGVPLIMVPDTIVLGHPKTLESHKLYLTENVNNVKNLKERGTLNTRCG
jgi:hypothetical protein